MLRCIAGVWWQDKVPSEEVAQRYGLKEIQRRVRWRKLQ